MFWIFSWPCFCDHQLNKGFEFLPKIPSSSNDPTNATPSISGDHNPSGAEVKLAEPRISRGSSWKAILWRYTQPWRKKDDMFLIWILFCNCSLSSWYNKYMVILILYILYQLLKIVIMAGLLLGHNKFCGNIICIWFILTEISLRLEIVVSFCYYFAELSITSYNTTYKQNIKCRKILRMYDSRN